jgi:hypothetical protein
MIKTKNHKYATRQKRNLQLQFQQKVAAAIKFFAKIDKVEKVGKGMGTKRQNND